MLSFFYFYKDILLYTMAVMGLLSFSSLRKHLLLTLLSLEYLVLCMYIFFVDYICTFMGDMYLLLIFLTFSVCEGVLGLSILVTMIRSYGNDYVNSLFIMKW
uniref:NADH-ubiquinone oxidoreductase chain 4L n=1 Tax=Mystilus priamus TaxID=2813419 RepID=A0A8T9ZZK4_9HEMI|nr:NADH dehydrogenase subunit 4L [Mystilus priamus]